MNAPIRVVVEAHGFPRRCRARIEEGTTPWRGRPRFRYVIETEWAGVWSDDQPSMWFTTRTMAEGEANDDLTRRSTVRGEYLCG